VLILVRRFLAVSVFQALAGAATGIIAARSLGPSGRGDLAAIIVPLSMAPYALSLGLTTFASRAAAAGRRLGLVLGTAGTMAFGIGCIAIPGGIALAHVLARDHQGVLTVLIVGFALLPVTLASNVLADMGLGLQRWGSVTAQRLVPMVTALVGYVALLALGRFTAASAGAVVLAGGLASVLPFAPVAKRARPLEFEAKVAREALRFGSRALPITVSQLLNHRLDQFLMVPLVSRRQLGLYAVAVTVSSLAGMLANAMNTVLYPKFAAGEDLGVARSLRRGLFAVTCIAVVTAIVSPVLLPAAFGSAFRDAVPMVLILLAASIPLAGVTILSAIFAAGKRILAAGMSEIGTLVLTVVGLLLLLRPLGGVGAAIVSLVAYSANFAWLLRLARKDHGGRWTDYLIIRRAELAEARGALRRLATLRGSEPAPTTQGTSSRST
jgi:O-antigen/teichoic acid export membrane protein